jgi:hypothetical protein
MYGLREQVQDAIGLTFCIPLFYAIYILSWAIFSN